MTTAHRAFGHRGATPTSRCPSCHVLVAVIVALAACGSEDARSPELGVAGDGSASEPGLTPVSGSDPEAPTTMPVPGTPSVQGPSATLSAPTLTTPTLSTPTLSTPTLSTPTLDVEPATGSTLPAVPAAPQHAGSAAGGAPALDAGAESGSAPEGGGLPVNADAGPSRVDFEPLRVMSFNIRYDDGRNTSSADAWNAANNPRRERVADLIYAADPPLLGVQEALQNQVEDLRAALPHFGFVGVGRDDGDTRGEYAGIFYRLDRWELLDSGHFWLSETPEVPGTVFEGSGSIRMATWIIAEDRVARREVFFLNTHWDNVSQSSRQASAELVRERLAVLGQGRSLIVTGDLNQSESDASVRTLLATPPDPLTALFDAYRAVHPERAADELTFHDFGGATTGSRIDFVLHDAGFVAADAEIHRESFDGRYPSDHYAVSAQLEWADQ